MQEIFAVLGGGAIGAALRFVLLRCINELLPKHYPWGIWVINILGCFLIGVLAAIYLQKSMMQVYFWRAFFMVGVLGSFTTFSSFSLDTVLLLQQGEWITAMIYVCSSVLLCVAATFLGFFVKGVLC